MKVRIQRSMGVILCITLLILCSIFTVILYRENLRIMKETVEKEAEYISEGANLSGEEYITDIVAYVGDTRITLVDKDGTVILDTDEDPAVMENHADREEIVSAYQTGEGESIRYSDTIGQQTYYYAILLNNGDVVRVSKTMDSVLGTMWGIFPLVFGVGILMWIFAMVLASQETKKLIDPINQLNVDNPMDNDIYEEIQPLLVRIDDSNKARQEVEDMRKEFSANVSHELKTPLTSISGYAELMENGMVRVDDMSRFAGKIHTEAQRLIVLVEDIIKLSRLDEGRVELEKEEVDLFFLVREICTRLSLQANKKNVHIEISGQTVKVQGIKQVLDEMLYNVCENAIKYNKPGGSINIWVGATLDGAKVVVKDTGIGIPEDQQSRVFERFYRVDKSHSKDTGGTGLGLSIVKHGAILHNAQILLESELNKGTKIQILF